MHSKLTRKLLPLAVATGLALAAPTSQAQGLLDLLPGLSDLGGLGESSSPGQVADAADVAALRSAILGGFPGLIEQTAADPRAVWALFAMGGTDPGAADADFLATFADPAGFAGFMDLLATDQAQAGALFSSLGGDAGLLAKLTAIVDGLAGLPLPMANDLASFSSMMGLLTGSGLPFGLPNRDDGGLLAAALAAYEAENGLGTQPGSDACPQSEEPVPPLLGPVHPSSCGKGYGPSLLPYLGLGATPSGGLGHSLEWTPLLNSNLLTGTLRELTTRSLPVLAPILPADLLVLEFRTYHTTDRTGVAGNRNVPVNDPDWTAGAIDIKLPGIGRLFTIEMICPGLNRHRVAANAPDASNPGFDAQAEANYTGYSDLNLATRTLTLSWGFGDGLIDDLWIYGHYAPWTLFGVGDSGPGMHHPAQHQGAGMDDMHDM